jgi:hypothetical protein
MTDDNTSEHFEALIAAEVAVNDHGLTPKVIEDANRELALRAATRFVKSLSVSGSADRRSVARRHSRAPIPCPPLATDRPGVPRIRV